MIDSELMISTCDKCGYKAVKRRRTLWLDCKACGIKDYIEYTHKEAKGAVQRAVGAMLEMHRSHAEDGFGAASAEVEMLLTQVYTMAMVELNTLENIRTMELELNKELNKEKTNE